MMKLSPKMLVMTVMTFGLIGGGAYGARFMQQQIEQKESGMLDRLSAMESYVKGVKNASDLSLKTQLKQIQTLEQKLSSLALSVKTGSTDSEQAQELLKLILSTHHDLDVLIQALMSEQIVQGDPQKLQWVMALDRLSPQDKLNFQRMMDKRTQWKDVLSAIDEQLKKNQSVVLWGAAQRLGIRVENAASPQVLVLENLKEQVVQHNYNAACQSILDLPQDDPVAQKLEDVCLADSFVSQYWKSLSE